MNVKNNKKNDYAWELIFVLPNLNLKKTFEAEIIAVVPFDDNRLQKIISHEQSAEMLLTNFKTVTGKKINPCAFIWRKDVPKSVKRNEAVAAFRNTLGISSLIHGWFSAINSDNVFEPIYSDHFDFYPVTLSKKSGFIISTPAQDVLWPKVKEFHGQVYPHIPNHDLFKAEPDEFLADKIIKHWKARFVSPAKDSWVTRLLFRSLEVAYQALVTPIKNSTLYEYGNNLALWVSAFEILVHKRPGDRVGCENVLEFLGKYKWSLKKLRERRYKIFKSSEKPRGNLVQKLYRELYEARCDFLHGNQVKESRLFPFHNKELRLLGHLAPIIYWTALSVYLPSEIQGKDLEARKKAFFESWDKANYEKVLLSAVGKEP